MKEGLIMIFGKENKEKAIKKIYQVPEVKISLIGGTGSGKSTFLSGLIYSMSQNCTDFSNGCSISLKPADVITINSSINETSDEINEVRNIRDYDDIITGSTPINDNNDVKNEKNEKKRPDALQIGSKLKEYVGLDKDFNKATSTRSTSNFEMVFDVLVNGEKTVKVVFDDYAGEIINQSNGKDIPPIMQDYLMKQIFSSDSFIVLISSKTLCENVERNCQLNSKRSMFNETKLGDALAKYNIQNIITDIDKKNCTLLLTITQIDHPDLDKSAISKEIKRDNFSRTCYDLKYYIFKNIFNHAKNMEWSSGVVPVSAIGMKDTNEKNVNDQNELKADADLHPEGIDTAVLFCVFSELLKKIRDYNIEIQNINKKIIKTDGDRIKKWSLSKQIDVAEKVIKTINSDRDYFSSIYEKNIPFITDID